MAEKKPLTEEQKGKVLEAIILLNDGMPKAQAAKQVKVQRDTLTRWIEKEGYTQDQFGKYVQVDASMEMQVSASVSNQIASASDSEQLASNNKRKQLASNSKGELDSIDRLLLQENQSSKERVYKGFYLDYDIVQFLNSVKSGNRSDLVNELIRTTLKAKGLL